MLLGAMLPYMAEAKEKNTIREAIGKESRNKDFDKTESNRTNIARLNAFLNKRFPKATTQQQLELLKRKDISKAFKSLVGRINETSAKADDRDLAKSCKKFGFKRAYPNLAFKDDGKKSFVKFTEPKKFTTEKTTDGSAVAKKNKKKAAANTGVVLAQAPVKKSPVPAPERGKKSKAPAKALNRK